MPPAKKSIVVKGDGPYLGYLITEGVNKVKGTIWYDKSRQANEAIAMEEALIEAGIVKPTIFKAKGAKSGGNEKDCDLVVTVRKGKVIVARPKGKSKKVTLRKVKTISDLQGCAADYLKAVRDLLKD